MNKLPIYCCAMIFAVLSPLVADADNHSDYGQTFMIFSMPVSECEYTNCNKGKCASYAGTELCNCSGTGLGGLFCESPIKPWTSYACGNEGSQNYTFLNGETLCMCQSNFTGPRCQNTDPESKCVDVEEGDMSFLPGCTLKTFVGMIASCIDGNLPYQVPSSPNMLKTCNSQVWKTIRCIEQSFGNCGGKQCDKYHDNGAFEIYSHIRNVTLNPESSFIRALTKFLCTPPHNVTGFPDYDETFSIGAPVCKSDIIDRMIAALIEYGNRSMKPGVNICSELDTVRMELYQLAANSCDWNNITAALTHMDLSGVPADYWPSAFRLAHQEFLNWKIPACAAIDYQCYDDYCKNGGTCSLSGSRPYCNCPPGTSGHRCEESKCNNGSRSCNKGGTCHASGFSYLGLCFLLLALSLVPPLSLSPE